MSITEQVVDIVNGSGGPNSNAIPIYGDNKAPNGGWVYGANGKQLMLENTADSGIQYIIVNPALLTQEENQGSKFVTWKPNGEPNYVRMWILDPETGHGRDYAPGVTMWGEYTHLKVSGGVEPPEPPAGDTSTFIIDWNNRTITLKPE